MLFLSFQGKKQPMKQGAKTFACPLCNEVKTMNAKQHIVTLKCCAQLPITEEQRKEIANHIKVNGFLVRNNALCELMKNLHVQDQAVIKFVLMLLGGLIVNENFQYLNLRDIFQPLIK
jgi:transcription elongation factor Elf1